MTKKGAEALSHGMIRKGIIRMIPITEARIAILERYPNLEPACSVIELDGANCNKYFAKRQPISSINTIPEIAMINPVV